MVMLPLHLAAWEGHGNIVKLLLDANAEANAHTSLATWNVRILLYISQPAEYTLELLGYCWISLSMLRCYST